MGKLREEVLNLHELPPFEKGMIRLREESHLAIRGKGRRRQMLEEVMEFCVHAALNWDSGSRHKFQENMKV